MLMCLPYYGMPQSYADSIEAGEGRAATAPSRDRPFPRPPLPATAPSRDRPFPRPPARFHVLPPFSPGRARQVAGRL
jgi:hypothetical protein